MVRKGRAGVPPLSAPVPLSSSPMSMMSLSPTTSTSNYDDQPNGKRRRTTSFNNGHGSRSEMASPHESPAGHGAPPVPPSHIPKRGARACTNCRKGKNRCEGEVRLSPLIYTLLAKANHPCLPLIPVPSIRPSARPGTPNPHRQAPCRRCQLSGAQCVFEKPEKKNAQALTSASVE